MAKRRIKHALFSYYVETDDPINDRKRLVQRHAFRGDVVDIPREEDIRKGEKHDAFYDTVEPVADEDATTEFQIDGATQEQIVEHLETVKPNVGDTVELARGDATLAQRILDAETAATGGQPRQGVLNGLEAVVGSGD